MTTTGKPRKGAGRVTFLAHAEKIKELIASGHPQRSIYDEHAEALGISYSQFNRYVGKYVLGKTEGGHQKGKVSEAVPQPAPATPAPVTTGSNTAEAAPAKRGAFTHDANASKRNDLI